MVHAIEDERRTCSVEETGVLQEARRNLRSFDRSCGKNLESPKLETEVKSGEERRKSPQVPLDLALAKLSQFPGERSVV